MTGLVRDAFEGAAKNWPHRPAIWFNGKEILYAQLNARANQWARYLRTFDFQPTAPQPHAIFGEGLGPQCELGFTYRNAPKLVLVCLRL